MNQIVNISPLPFYPNLEMQNHRKDYAYESVFPLVTYKNMLMPFQFIIENRKIVAQALLCNLCSDETIDLTRSMIDRGLNIRVVDGYTLVEYPASLPIPEITKEGTYYLRLIVANPSTEGMLPTDPITVYSEVFVVRNSVNDCLKIEYRNSKKLRMSNGVADFPKGFRFRVYLETELGKPKYNFEEEGTERNGYLYVEHQVSKKVYQCGFTAPEYLLDALRVIRLCDTRRITNKGIEYYPLTLNIDSSWLEQGDVANATLEFEVDNIIAENGNHYIYERGGDFSADFNNDYNI